MNVICLDCGQADPESIWEYEETSPGDGPDWSKIADLIVKHRGHRLIFL